MAAKLACLTALVLLAVGGCSSPTPESVWKSCTAIEYPPLKWAASSACRVTNHSLCLSPTVEAMSPTSAELHRYPSSDHGCGLAIDVAPGGTPPASVPSEWREHDGGYAWSAVADGGVCRVTIYADSPGAADHAVHALVGAAFGASSSVPSAAADWPSFPVRGVIEGFYNQYFSPSERRQTMLLMHQARLGTYLYAPKDDVYAGYRWRDAYPDDAAADLAAAAADAAELGIDLVYGISPTLSTNGQGPETSIRFSSADDFAALVSKLTSVRALGVTRFALLFDDASRELYHAEDRAAFASAAAAHADLANRLVAAFGERLLLVPAYYSSLFDKWDGYAGELGSTLGPRVDVLWTGPAVFSETIAASDLAQINALLGRQVFIWDNWPTSAVPVTGRSVDLPSATPAILTNATMVGDYGHPASDFLKVIGPLGDYGWDAASYDADASFARWQDTMSRMLGCMR